MMIHGDARKVSCPCLNIGAKMTARILIIDDEERIVDLLKDVLEEKGYKVKGAFTGEDAVRLASSEEFRVAVVDMSLPGMDGLETFAALRNEDPAIIGIMITGYGTLDTAVEAMKLGFSGILKKPFTPNELVELVTESLEKAVLIEENTRLKALIPLYRLGEKFITSTTEKKVLEELVETIFLQTGAQRISVMLYDKDEVCLRIAAAKGIEEEIIPKVQIRSGERIAGWVFEKSEPLILNNGPKSNPEFAPYLEKEEIVAAISLPMKTRDKTIGVINVSKVREGTPFSQSDIEMLSIICSQAVMAIENIRVMEERTERIRVQTLLEQYVAPEVAELLISHGHNPLDLGEVKDMTALFADIRNFTHLVQELPLETIRSFLNDFFKLLSEIIFRFNGTLDKFMGDAALAVFGAPINIDKPNDAAVSAALEILEAFARLKERWIVSGHPFAQVGLGIGIGAGEMFLGNVGSERRLDYTVIGTDVNLAQRLASEADSGQILISKKVMDRLSAQFNITWKASYQLKGLESPIHIFSVNAE
jgi:adenylate cyclase